MRLKAAYRAYQLLLTFSTRNQTQESQHADWQIHLVSPFAFGKSLLGKGFSIFSGIVFRGSTAPCNSWHAKHPKWQLRRMDWSTSLLISSYCKQELSAVLLCTALEGPRLGFFFSCNLFLQSLGSSQALPACYTHAHICHQDSLCAQRQVKGNLSQV